MDYFLIFSHDRPPNLLLQQPGGLLLTKNTTRSGPRKGFVIIFTKEPEYGIVFRMKLR